jgi:hypothetical protein
MISVRRDEKPRPFETGASTQFEFVGIFRLAARLIADLLRAR